MFSFPMMHALCLLVGSSIQGHTWQHKDPHNIRNGSPIPNEGYCDEPYVVLLEDGTWLCTLTTGPLQEGHVAQHVVCTRSRDHGKTWSDLVDIEPSEGPEASWIVPLKTPGGRVYGFYTYNGENVRTLSGEAIRADTLGWYCYRFSDDGGLTWSRERYRVPLRVTACDRTNDWNGQVQLFWGIDKPWILDGSVYFAFTKLGRYMLEQGEGWLLRSDNILWEKDPTKIHWELLPEGEHGLRHPDFGSTQEEHNAVPLNDGKSLYCVYRTTLGHPCHTYSRDSGKTWNLPEPMTYSPQGPLIKTPRACARVWKTRSGRYLFWFHNHGGRDFNDRNPAWISGGLEHDGFLHWSQPEILLYDPDPKIRMSYPDLIEQDGRTWITATNKSMARVHEIDPDLLEGLWSQGRENKAPQQGRVLHLSERSFTPSEVKLACPLDLDETGGFTLEGWFSPSAKEQGVFLDSRNEQGNGFVLEQTERNTFVVSLFQGQNRACWESDERLLHEEHPHHIAVIVDHGPKLILFVIDGVLCDGGQGRQYGWGRYEGEFGRLNPAGRIRLGPALSERCLKLRIYSRALRISEAVACFQEGT